MKSLLSAAFVLSIAGSAHAQLSPFNAAGITYGHVHLNVKDIEVQKKLWVEHFDGVVVQKGPLTAVKLPNMLVAFLVKEPTGSSEGTVVPGPLLQIGNTTSRVDFGCHPGDWVDAWSNTGISHHWALGVGHRAGELKAIAQLLDLEFVQVQPTG